MSQVVLGQNRIATAERWRRLVLDLATLLEASEVFHARLEWFSHLALTGRKREAEEMWSLLDPMGRDWPRYLYRPGEAEYLFAAFQFWNGALREEQLLDAERLARTGRGRSVIRSLHLLRGAWYMERGKWELAVSSLHEAVRMARESQQTDEAAEAQLALAKLHLGRLNDPRNEAERLEQGRLPAHRHLAVLWLAIGDRERATKHALAAYKWAWADGEPYVRRYALNKSRELLEHLGVDVPVLPLYDPANDPKLPWEDKVAAAIERLRAEKADKRPD
jgi:tetratricopeptide (TPR) repeat protein